MTKRWKHIYGPVPSRRLGLSLGVDLVPYKTCNFDCIYCQLGRTKKKSLERKRYIKATDILDNLFEALKHLPEPDFITLGGSGEPTLNSDIGIIIREIKRHSDRPVAVLTNGSLMSSPEVRENLCAADVILPSLDAGDEKTFRKINRPHGSLNLKDIIKGMSDFRKEFAGAIWLEVFLIDAINTSGDNLKELKKAIERIKPDRIQLNTAVRPPAESFVKPVGDSELLEICSYFGSNCEVIAQKPDLPRHGTNLISEDALLAILSRRPCTLSDLSKGLNASANLILKTISELQRRGLIKSYFQNRDLFYSVTSE